MHNNVFAEDNLPKHTHTLREMLTEDMNGLNKLYHTFDYLKTLWKQLNCGSE